MSRLKLLHGVPWRHTCVSMGHIIGPGCIGFPRLCVEESASSTVPSTEKVKVMCNATRPGPTSDVCIHTLLSQLSD